MQALSAASSYFLLDGDAWRISTNFAAENVLMDNDYLYDLGGPSRWIRTEDEYRRSRQKKNLKRKCQQASRH
jgi:hypothetical protein